MYIFISIKPEFGTHACSFLPTPAIRKPLHQWMYEELSIEVISNVQFWRQKWTNKEEYIKTQGNAEIAGKHDLFHKQMFLF
jgi:hypothetical protein